MAKYLPQGKVTNDQVDRIYQHIQGHPGIGIKKISEELSIGFVAVKTGVNQLVQTGKIKKQQTSDRTVKLFVIGED